jgi:hypothetical protein
MLVQGFEKSLLLGRNLLRESGGRRRRVPSLGVAEFVFGFVERTEKRKEVRGDTFAERTRFGDKGGKGFGGRGVENGNNVVTEGVQKRLFKGLRGNRRERVRGEKG